MGGSRKCPCPFLRTHSFRGKCEAKLGIPRRRGIQNKKPGGGVLPYMGYIGMCSPKGYGFSVILVINTVSNLADSGHK